MKRNRLNLIIDAISLLVLLGLIQTGLILKYVLPPGSGGHGGGRGAALLGWTRHDWGDVHFWMSLTMVVLMLVHVVLHWGWVCTITRQVFRGAAEPNGGPGTTARDTRYGLAFLAALVILLGGLFAWSRASVGTVAAGDDHGRGWRGGRSSAASVAERGHGTERQALGNPSRTGENTWAQADTAPAASRPAFTQRHNAGDAPRIRGSMTLNDIEVAYGVPPSVILRELGLPKDTPTDERLGRLRQGYDFDMEEVREIVERARSSRRP